MSMVTRCPSCNTRFRVTPQQLQTRQGQVRCGRCLTLFDGYLTLASLTDPAPAPAAGAESTGPAFELQPIEIAPAAPEPFSAAPAPAAEDRDYGPPPQQLTLDDPSFLEPSSATARRGSRLWAAASAVALLVLAGQGIYAYRGEIAANVPGLKRYLVLACDWLECTVPLPQRPKLIAIEASDLQAIDPTRPGLIQLTATLRNHAGYDLAFPALDLVLTNTKEHTLARRIFLPAEYLERGKDARAGIPANAETTIRLDLDTGALNAAGFRLDLLPAPVP